MAQRGEQLLIGVDLNATRLRAVGGSPDAAPRSLLPDGSHDELPLALSLQGRSAEVGQAGLALCRRSPHLACSNFLPHLGTPRQWQGDRVRLDSDQALSLVLQQLQRTASSCRGAVLVMPAYLTPAQVELVAAAAQKARLPLLGSLTSPLAAALAAYAEQPWYGTAVVVDVDDHALTLVTMLADRGMVQILDMRILPHLSLRLWKDRLLAAVADRCIQQSRRDPRDSAIAEQSLYDHLEEVLNACRQGRMVELAIHTAQWYQNLFLQPEEIIHFCAALTRPVVDALEAARAATKPQEPPRVVLLTATAGRLPGLVAALQECLDHLTPETPVAASSDFGDGLLEEAPGEPMVTVLAPDALARAAHALARRWQELSPGHLDLQAPVSHSDSVEAGPARLHFRGQDFLLNQPSFTLGRRPTCDLVFDSEMYPTVSGWHAEVVASQHNYILRDRSRHGTLVNDRPVLQQVTLSPGDWIRLGPDGPLLRFLGQATDPRRLMTTA